ncbi:MAG: ATP phosphoribosyltransferase, partial [Minisyncoccia bacterium]
MSSFKIGIPNGSLYEKTIKLFKKLGIEIIANGRSFEAEIIGEKIFERALIMRPQSIPMAIMQGVIDCGICGWDCVIESGTEEKLVKIVELNYSKKSNDPVKVVVFGRKNTLEDNENIAVSSEYPNITKKLFKKARIDFSYGTTEAQVVAGMFDYGVCITETGISLRDNDLYILKTLLVSPTVLISRENLPEILTLGKLIKGALRSEEYQLVKMNVDAGKKNDIISMLPALKSPTVNNLADGSIAIEIVVEKRSLLELLVLLDQTGATDILVSDLNVI